MNSSNWADIECMLATVIELPSAERAARLDELCANRPELRAQVESLLAAHDRADSFMESGVRMSPGVGAGTPMTGKRLGNYQLLDILGQGGMGTVYRAERTDGRFQKQVAVKIAFAALHSPELQRRFASEQQILASLEHANIERLLDAGVSPEGIPYLVMEYVEGVAVNEYCCQAGLSTRNRLKLFQTICSAVHYAHQRLVVHRDIKPANILVTSDGTPKLLDFGVAKILNPRGDQAMDITRSLLNPMTPSHASPEQVRGETLTTATDVYSLGVVLYELLTEKLPYELAGKTFEEALRIISETEPKKPTAVIQHRKPNGRRRESRPLLESPSDIDAIVAKAMRKDAQQRYASAQELSDDLARYLQNEPVRARPASLPYRMKKYARRHRTAVALASLAFASLIAGLTGTIIQARRARVQRDFAFRQLSRAEAINDLENFLLTDAAPSGKPFTVYELLDRAEQIVERQHGTDADRVDLLISIGRQYAGEDEAAKALRVLEHAYQLSRGVQEHTTRSDASCALGSALAYTQDLSRAEALFQEGLNELPQEPQYVLNRSSCLLRGREIADARGDSRAAIARVQEAQHLLQHSAFDSEILQLRVSIDLAEAYREAGRYSEAITAFEQASTRLSGLGRDNTETAGTLYNNWAMALLQVGRPLEAEKVFRRALEISRSDNTDAAVSATVLLNYGKTLHELGRLNEAADYVERACAKVRQAGDEVVTKQSLLERARIYREQHKLARATEMLTQVEPRLRRDLPPTHYAFASLASERSLIALATFRRKMQRSERLFSHFQL